MNPDTIKEGGILAIIGAGAMGAALAIPAAEAGSKVRLWFTEYDKPILEALQQGNPHPRLGTMLPKSTLFYPPDKLGEVLEDADAVIVAVSSQGLPSVLDMMVEAGLDGGTVVGVITKGFEERGGLIYTSGELVAHAVGTERTVYLAGPSLAGEVARRRPTPVALASGSREAAGVIAGLLSTRWYRTVLLSDLRGASLAASLKNPYAILYGIVEGMEESIGEASRNLKAGLLTAVIGEMAGIVGSCGGRAETVYTLAGLGDVLVTVMGGRNSQFGRLLGRGLGVGEALEEMRRRGVGVVEGYTNTREALRYLESRCSKEVGEALLLESVASVLEERATVREVVGSLVERVASVLSVGEGGAAAGI